MQYYQLYANINSQDILCHVIVFNDGQTIIKWCGKVKSLVVHQSLDEFKQISVTGERYLLKTYSNFSY